jgi:hypothetical protein
MDWAGEITDLFHYGNQDMIHQAIQGIRTRYNGEFDATILLDQLDQLKTPEGHWAFTSPAAMIGAAIGIFVVGLCLWKCCCRTQEAPQPQPSAPPMPLAILAQQPASAPRTAPTLVPKNNNNRHLRATMPFQSTSPSPRSIKTFSSKNPEEGRDIRNDIFCKFCKYLI